MSKYSVKEVNGDDAKTDLGYLYAQSAITLTGLSKESIPDFIQWLEDNAGCTDNITVYIISGKLMNEFYCLIGDNRYPEDLTIVSVGLDDLINSAGIIMKRFEVGGRWFDDIVDNNVRRENE